MTTLRACHLAVAREAVNLRGHINNIRTKKNWPQTEIDMREAHLVDLEAAERLLRKLCQHPQEVHALVSRTDHDRAHAPETP